MKLAEALNLRADLQVRINNLRTRLSINARVQEGEKPAEDPAELLAELDGCIRQLEEIIYAINLTNSRTETEKGTLTMLLARRDCLRVKVSVYQDFCREASGTVDRMTRTEIKILSTVPVKEIQKTCDSLSKEYRELDVFIQSVNWTTELIGL